MPLIDDDRRKWWLLAAMGSVLGVILLDETVVGVALHDIQTDLGLSEIGAHWVVNIYMLVLAGLAAAAGRFGDMVGHRNLMLTGLAVFGLASLACGVAETGSWLIAARGVQGAGAAIIFPTSLAMVTIAFPENLRGLALGIYGAFGTVFLAIGPLVGGFLTDFISWHWIFLVNPPIVVAIGLVVLAAWKEPVGAAAAGALDKPGLLTLIGGLAMLVFAIMQGPDWGWTDATILSLLAMGVLLLSTFIWVELRRPDPLIEVDLFANPTFAGCNLVIFSAQFFKMAIIVFTALYLQEVLEMSPFIAGLALLPTAAPQPFTAVLAGRIVDRREARWPTLGGVALMLAGLAWIAFFIPWNNYLLVGIGLLATGLAMAFLFVPPQHAVMGAVPPHKQGQAGGIAMSSQLLGATIGMAVSSTVYSMTSDYQSVFAVNAGFALLVLIVGWLTIQRKHGSAPQGG